MPLARLKIELLFSIALSFALPCVGCTSSGGADVGGHPDPSGLTEDLRADSNLDLGTDSGSGGSDGSADLSDAALPPDLSSMRCGDLACVPDGIIGKAFTATGTWTGSNGFQVSCAPGSPGRDANGCCPHSSPLGPSPSSIEFEIVQLPPGPGGALQLHVSATSLDSLGGRITTTQSGPQVTDSSFQIRPFVFPTRLTYTIEGLLDASWTPPKLMLGFSGSGFGSIGSGRCNQDSLSLSVRWEVMVP